MDNISTKETKTGRRTVFRLLGILLVLLIVAACLTGTTFSRYTTERQNHDTARAVLWFGKDEMIYTVDEIKPFFESQYDIDDGDYALTHPDEDYTVENTNGTNIIAPGTEGGFSFDAGSKFISIREDKARENAEGEKLIGPEIAYTVFVRANGNIDPKLEKAVRFNVIRGTYTDKDGVVHGAETTAARGLTYTEMLNYINSTEKLDYEAWTIPQLDDERLMYTIEWYWDFNDGGDTAEESADIRDTYLGAEARPFNNEIISLTIRVIAEQADVSMKGIKE